MLEKAALGEGGSLWTCSLNPRNTTANWYYCYNSETEEIFCHTKTEERTGRRLEKINYYLSLTLFLQGGLYFMWDLRCHVERIRCSRCQLWNIQFFMISLDAVNSPSCQLYDRGIVKLNINFLGATQESQSWSIEIIKLYNDWRPHVLCSLFCFSR